MFSVDSGATFTNRFLFKPSGCFSRSESYSALDAGAVRQVVEAFGEMARTQHDARADGLQVAYVLVCWRVA